MILQQEAQRKVFQSLFISKTLHPTPPAQRPAKTNISALDHGPHLIRFRKLLSSGNTSEKTNADKYNLVREHFTAGYCQQSETYKQNSPCTKTSRWRLGSKTLILLIWIPESQGPRRSWNSLWQLTGIVIENHPET